MVVLTFCSFHCISLSKDEKFDPKDKCNICIFENKIGHSLKNNSSPLPAMVLLLKLSAVNLQNIIKKECVSVGPNTRTFAINCMNWSVRSLPRDSPVVLFEESLNKVKNVSN